MNAATYTHMPTMPMQPATQDYQSTSPRHESYQLPTETPMILVNSNNVIISINNSAAHLIDVFADVMKGQPVEQLGSALAAIAKHPTKPGSSNLMQLPNGRTVLATTRNVVGRNNKKLGRVVSLQEINVEMNELRAQAAESSSVGTLQSKIQNMQELVAMIPQFSNNKYWQNLLVEHMQRIISEMTSEVSQLNTQHTHSPLS